MNKPIISMFNATTLELHYWFRDETHTMNAVVQNKCENEFLGIIKEIAATFDAEITIETEPLADGGIRRWYNIVAKSEQKKAIITTAIITALISSLIVTPITTVVSKLTEKVIENIFEDKELMDLGKEKLKEEINNLKIDTELKLQKLNKSNVIVKKRSNFYEALEKYSKVNKVSIVIVDENKNHNSDEIFVDRENFKEFVLVSDEIEAKEIDEAVIEIISPVLKKGNYKWRGVYNGEIISFNMKSIEFKALIQTGKIQFKNGTTINCSLVVRRKIDNEGNEIIAGYDVLRVNKYFENDKPFETIEGKHHRQKKEADKQQVNLFDNE